MEILSHPTLSNWTASVPESEIRRLLRFKPKYYFAGGKPGNIHISSLKEIVSTIISEDLEPLIERNGPISNHNMFNYVASEGVPSLRKILATRLRLNDGIPIGYDEWENVMITTGSQQTVFGILSSMLNPKDVIIVPSPTYLGFIGPASILQAEILTVPTDDFGIIPEAVEAACDISKEALGRPAKILYIQSFSDNPMGITLSTKRKKQLFDIAEKWNLLIIEDAAYKEIRFDRSSKLNPIKALDKDNNRVAYISTTSKEAGVLRIGYSLLPDYLKPQFVKIKGFLDLCTSAFTQEIATKYYESYIDQVLPDIVKEYKNQCETMKKAIDDYLPGKRTDPNGGFFIWHKFDKPTFNSSKLLKEAIDSGVIYVPGNAFYPTSGYSIDTSSHSLISMKPEFQSLRLSFSLSKEDEIYNGIKTLGNLMESY